MNRRRFRPTRQLAIGPEDWPNLIRAVAHAAERPEEDAAALGEHATRARQGWPIPQSVETRKRHVIAALPHMAQAYAQAPTTAARLAVAEPLLAWAKACAELLGVDLSAAPTRRLPYKDE